jgi:3-deoxy-7-phosphoheptulonate synthase
MKPAMEPDWRPDSWRSREARQQPAYLDEAALDAATAELAAYPPLVPLAEVEALGEQLAQAQAGRAFLLQGGDCAESFAEFSPGNIRLTYRLIDAMARQLAAASGLPVIRLARIAGQFAKPRSIDPETREGRALPAYRGDIVNGIAFDAAARVPDPDRMFRAYAQASATLAHLRDLSQADGVPIYTCHEALLLPFEEALVRPVRGRWGHVETSAHFLWVGDRTRFAGSAHIEFARGLANPIGVKCGPSLQPDELAGLLETLNPDRAPGRITLISRMGADRIAGALPPLVRAVARAGQPVLWSCDPMHGNTIKSPSGYKTRPLAAILSEVRSFFRLLPAEGAHPGGIHIEMTGRDVTECTGGAAPVRDQDLASRYHSHCDPRLNAGQAMELADLLAEMLDGGRRAA